MSDISYIEVMRKKTGMTQEAVSNELNVARSTYISWTKGTPIPSDKLLQLARLYNCSCDYLLGLSPFLSVDNQYIHEKTGLSEASIDYLSRCQKEANSHKLLRDAIRKTGASIKTSFGDSTNPIASTVNFLLAPENTKRGSGGLIHLINQYLSTPDTISLSGTDEGKNITIRGTTGFTIPTADLIRGGLLGMIQTRLVQDREKYRKIKR